MTSEDIIKVFLDKLRITWHFLFWCVSFLVLLQLFSSSSGAKKIDVIYTIVFILPIIFFSYLNLYILVPLLLKKGKFFLYLLTFAATVLIASGCIYLLFDRWIDFILKDYYFINYLGIGSLLIYTSSFLALSTLLKIAKEWAVFIRDDRQQSIIQLKNLQAQINPHFLLNSLQTIYSLSLNNSEKTPETILQLSEILKFSLYESETNKVLLSREIEVMKDYIDMYRLRLDPIRAKISFTETRDPADNKIVPLLFLPFIENSFKHGLQGSEKEAFVDIDFQIIKNKVTFIIENNLGISNKNDRPEYSGIGIENTKMRLNLSYPNAHILNIDNTGNTFKVYLEINLKNK